jgi:uncharacterized Rmd1/YagE family protein
MLALTVSMQNQERQRRPVASIALGGVIDLEGALSLGTLIRRYPYGACLEVDQGRLYLFHFGAAALVGAERWPGELSAALERAAGKPLLAETAETYWLCESPEASRRKPRVGWDQVAVHTLTPALEASVALLLAQSAALERYELAADQLVEEALAMARALELRGRPPRRGRSLARQVGRVTAERLSMTNWLYLVDRPEETWEDAEVAALYDALFENLELHSRHEAMMHKLEVVEGATRAVLELVQERSAHNLEWAIVLLIIAEIVLALVGVS